MKEKRSKIWTYIRQWRWRRSCSRSYVDCWLRRFNVYEQPIGPKSSITST